MSDKQFKVGRGGSGHDWYITNKNGRHIALAEYEHTADDIAKKLNAYPKLVAEVKNFLEYIEMLREQFPGKLTATSTVTEALLTELGEI